MAAEHIFGSIMDIKIANGEEPYAAIERFLDRQNVQAGVLLAAEGHLARVHLRVPSTPDTPTTLRLDGPMGLVAISGLVSVHRLHVHVAANDARGECFGGHLMREGNPALGTVHVALGVVAGLVFREEPDPETGYKELTIEEL